MRPILAAAFGTMQANSFLQQLKTKRSYENQIAHVERIPARRAWYADLERPLPRQLKRALEAAGIGQFYVHQAEAINAIRRGEHVVVATPTASGKTLVYNVPVIERCMLNWRSRALYLFPTKALAQDQMRALGQLVGADLSRIRVGIYDGDTPQAARSEIRRRASILLTNPDMLHLAILPHHQLWSSFFKNLRYVVMDEAHVYRGVFGSQVGCVLRRLRRICAAYGNRPQFVACSATIANPSEHIETLTGVRPLVVDQDGAPQGERTFVLWNPPLVDQVNGIRRSANTEAANLFTALVQNGIRNLTFARTRRIAELILRYTQESFQNASPELAARIAAYRAGYMPEERRALEQALFSGQLLGLVTTSALELGIDVGHLDATVLVGYPGTIASMWQQAGRAGRGEGQSLTLMIGQDSPIDQYFMRHPKELFDRTHEAARSDPGNRYVLQQHLPCAAYEVPLRPEDEELFGGSYVEAMVQLEESGELDYRNDRWFQTGEDYPARRVGLRSAGGRRVLLVDTTRENEVIEEIDAATAYFRVHPGAVYLHQGASYVVSELNWREGLALARPTDVDYYTQPRELNNVNIVRSLRHREFPSFVAYCGQVRVMSHVVGYARKKQFSDEVLSNEPLDLPPQTFETMAVWWDVPPEMAYLVSREGRDFAGGLHAVEHASISMLPLLAMCDRLDLGGVSTVRHSDTERPLICVYDAYPGGVGLAERGFEMLEAWWAATLEAIRNCPCTSGCPSCIHSPKCGNNNEPLDKGAAIQILETLLAQEAVVAR